MENPPYIPLKNQAASEIWVWCTARDCEHKRRFTGAELIERFGGETGIWDVMARVRCSACGKRFAPYDLPDLTSIPLGTASYSG